MNYTPISKYDDGPHEEYEAWLHSDDAQRLEIELREEKPLPYDKGVIRDVKADTARITAQIDNRKGSMLVTKKWAWL